MPRSAPPAPPPAAPERPSGELLAQPEAELVGVPLAQLEAEVKGRTPYHWRRSVRNQLRALVQSCPKGHPYDAANTFWRRDGRRECRACRNTAARIYGLTRRRPSKRDTVAA